jgi:hypothetical protein
MRKKIITTDQQEILSPDQDWLNLEAITKIEMTSEDVDYPIEGALIPGKTPGWRASTPGKQMIILLFPQPQDIKRIRLSFVETRTERTQEYLLRYSSDSGKSSHEILRQQWNFSPEGTTSETEEHHVDLQSVTMLELIIIPDTSGKEEVRASLEKLQLA